MASLQASGEVGDVNLCVHYCAVHALVDRSLEIIDGLVAPVFLCLMCVFLWQACRLLEKWVM